MSIYYDLIRKHNISISPNGNSNFLDKWYISNIKNEIEVVYNEIKKENNPNVRNLFSIILSRTARSCRATRHYDLATLKDPQFETYYCRKHKKICKPIMTIKNKFQQYADDTIKRIFEYRKVKKATYNSIITGDAKEIDIFKEVKKKNINFYNLLKEKRIKGIFTSPPYVGNINYHEQHAYAYELFGLERKDEFEIGPLFRGKGKEARRSYIEGISNVLVNCKRFMSNNFDIFIVANDSYNLYPT